MVRLSGPNAFTIAFTFFKPAENPAIALSSPTSQADVSPSTRCSVPSTQYSVLNTRSCRRRYEGQLHLPELSSSIPASLLAWPGPKTYTGQDLAEIHLLGCPPFVDLLVASLLHAGARAAQPGEFTMRAFLAGKLDLPRAEAVLGIIEAGNRNDLRQALGQLAGGLTRPLEGLREDLLDLLAEVEAGLDFAEEDIRFVEPQVLLCRLAKGLAQVTLLWKQLEKRAVSGEAFRVVLAGRPNAGKSSLFNALTGAGALVSPEPGTTRDYLIRRMEVDRVSIDLIDTAGWRESGSSIEEQAQLLGRQQAEQADLILLCLEAGLGIRQDERKLMARTEPPAVCPVTTKCDLAEAPPNLLATSVKTRTGLDVLRMRLTERARQKNGSSLAPSLSRCRHHVQAALDHLRQAHSIVLFQEPAELLALELRGALNELGEMVGAVYSDDLLDRIFSRFCIGK
jgi:tRNA modification GTPase